MRIKRQASVLFALFGLIWFQTVHAAKLLVDDFSAPLTATGFVDDPGILGGERDVVANGVGVTSDISGGVAIASSSENSRFVAYIYDGNDDNAGNVGYLLGGVDLTDAGTNEGLVVDITEIIGTVGITVIVSNSASDSGNYSISISSPGLVFLPFDSFLLFGLGSPTNVDRLFLRFELDSGESITMNEFYADSDMVYEDGFEQ